MSGIEKAFVAIAAEAFGLAEDDVRVVAGDTASSPYAGVSGGSKVTYTFGRAVERAAERGARAAARGRRDRARDRARGPRARRRRGPARRLARAAASRSPSSRPRCYTFGSPHAPIEGYGGVAQTSRAPGAAAHLSHVRVDRETGAVTLLAHVIAQDVGRALNPALVEGQMHGGTAQGIGWALLEELAHDETGQLRTGSFVEYALPVDGRVPPIDAEIVEVPAPDGPFGAKGIGEPPVVGVAGRDRQRDRGRDRACACASCR